VGVDLEVAEGLVSLTGQQADELEVAAGGEQGGDVAGIELVESCDEPVLVAGAEQPGCQVSEIVDVLAGVVEVDDLGGGREQLTGQVPDLISAARSTRACCARRSPSPPGSARAAPGAPLGRP
jgi:hypothetical protein